LVRKIWRRREMLASRPADRAQAGGGVADQDAQAGALDGF
jgi:hypothetical protein